MMLHEQLRPTISDLSERFRPGSLDDFIAVQPVIACARNLMARGLGGRRILVTGKTSTGKTSLCRIMARSHADDIGIEEFDARDLTIQGLRDIEANWRYYGMGKPGRAFIANEAHRCRDDVLSRWLTTAEQIPSHVCWFWTTTVDGQEFMFDERMDAKPFMRRCTKIHLSDQGLFPKLVARLMLIASECGYALPEKKAALVVRESGNCLGEAIEWLESPAGMEYLAAALVA